MLKRKWKGKVNSTDVERNLPFTIYTLDGGKNLHEIIVEIALATLYIETNAMSAMSTAH